MEESEVVELLAHEKAVEKGIRRQIINDTENPGRMANLNLQQFRVLAVPVLRCSFGLINLRL